MKIEIIREINDKLEDKFKGLSESETRLLANTAGVLDKFLMLSSNKNEDYKDRRDSERDSLSNKQKLNLVLDMSSSMNRDFLKAILLVADILCKQKGCNAELNVGAFNESSYRPARLDNIDEIAKFEGKLSDQSHSRIDAALNCFTDKNMDDINFVLTDGILEQNHGKSDMNINWLVLDNPNFKAPCGKTFDLTNKNILDQLKKLTPSENQ